MGREATPRGGGLDHGPHTLRVWRGTVVGVFGNDVFVDLGPRSQGVIARTRFEADPREGDCFDFTLHGQEEGLWVLSRVEERPLPTWDEMEVGAIVQARATGVNPGGLELKIGALHAFMPRGQIGVPRGTDVRGWLGKTLPCQVIEVDRERQRVLVSRRALLERERRGGDHQRSIHALCVGQVVHGQVSRVEAYGVFVRFGEGLEGLVHVSNLSYDPVRHPAELMRPGQRVEAKVLSVRREGKRIGLGIKQMQPSPWRAPGFDVEVGALLEGSVTRCADFGVFVTVQRGIEGLLPNVGAALPPNTRLRDVTREGERLAVRVVELDRERERMTLSVLHADGRRIAPDEAAGVAVLRERRAQTSPRGAGGESLGTNLGELLRRARRDSREP